MKKTVFVLFLLLFVVSLDVTLGQCAMCKEIVESNIAVVPGDQGTVLPTKTYGRGLNSGILYLMAIPYIFLFFLFRKKLVPIVRDILKLNKA